VIYCRIFLNGEKGDFSTQQQLDPLMWDKSNERVTKKHPNQVILNNLIDELIKGIYDCIITLKSINSDITLNKIKEVVFNKNHTSVTTKREPTIKEISDLYLKELTLKTDIKLLSKETLKGYKSSINKFIIYLKKHKKSVETINDIPKDLYFQFEQFLLQQKGISSNYAHKVIKHCDRMLLYAYKHGWVTERKDIQLSTGYTVLGGKLRQSKIPTTNWRCLWRFKSDKPIKFALFQRQPMVNPFKKKNKCGAKSSAFRPS
jgi:hypothetical protein